MIYFKHKGSGFTLFVFGENFKICMQKIKKFDVVPKTYGGEGTPRERLGTMLGGIIFIF